MRDRFSNAIGALLETFGCEVTRPMVHGYHLGLSDLSVEDVERAVAIAIQTETTVPRPARLRQLVLGSPDSLAQAAWSDACRGVALGPYKHIDFSDRRINAAIRSLGGWPAFVSRFSSAEEEKWLRIEFMKAYRSLERFSAEAGSALPGLAEYESRGGKVCPAQVRRIVCRSVKAIQRIAPDKREPPKLF